MPQCMVQKSGFSAFQNSVETGIKKLTENKILDRIKHHDYMVWQSKPDEITNRLGWLDIAERMMQEIESIENFITELKADGFTQVLLLGMGGSSLAPELFSNIFSHEHRGLALHILDSTDPEMVLECRRWSDQEKTLFVVSSKSGGTAETYSFFKYFYTLKKTELGDAAGSRFMVITDPGSELEKIASDLKFRRTFINDPNIGGRFSALSLFGLVPAALAGVDLIKLLKSALDADWQLAAELGAIMGRLALEGKDKLTFVLSGQILNFGDWAEQLIAESTGKNGAGILPVVGEPLLSPEDYGTDRIFVHLKMSDDTAGDSRLDMLAHAGFPVITLTLTDLYQLGEQFFIWELATAVACYFLKINPFDQPNVESAKVAARHMISTYMKSGVLPEPEITPLTNEIFNSFIEKATPGAYVALQAYIPMNNETIRVIHRIQAALLQKTRLAVTAGFGPRFLHSTGQLHKGDRGNGLFIQITCDPDQDAPIPNAPGDDQSDMTFSILKTAQAMGDFQALQNEKRHCVHFHLSGNLESGLHKILSFIS